MQLMDGMDVDACFEALQESIALSVVEVAIALGSILRNCNFGLSKDVVVDAV